MKQLRTIEMFVYTCPNCGNILRTVRPEIYHFCPHCAYPIKVDEQTQQEVSVQSAVDKISQLDSIISQYDKYVERAEKIIPVSSFDAEKIELNGDTISVTGQIYACGYSDYVQYEFPAEWLFLDDEELKIAKQRQQEEERKREEALRKQQELETAKKLEEEERAELARLKAKYESH